MWITNEIYDTHPESSWYKLLKNEKKSWNNHKIYFTILDRNTQKWTLWHIRDLHYKGLDVVMIDPIAIECCRQLWCYTLGFLAEISFTPLLYHPWGCFGCPEMQTSTRNYNLFVWSAVLQPKWNNIEKTYCFLGYY